MIGLIIAAILGCQVVGIVGECNMTALDSCLTPLNPLLDSPLIKGIPSTREAVHTACRAFKGGMACIDRHADNCLSASQKALLEKHVAGARHTFAFLCDDSTFQDEFLKHQACFRGTSQEWEYCAKFFQLLVIELTSQNITKPELNLGLCCAKHAFLRCVYYRSQYKCPKDAGLFLMRLAQTLSDVQIREDSCRKIKFDQVCTSSGGTAAVPLKSFANFPHNISQMLILTTIIYYRFLPLNFS